MVPLGICFYFESNAGTHLLGPLAGVGVCVRYSQCHCIGQSSVLNIWGTNPSYIIFILLSVSLVEDLERYTHKNTFSCGTLR